MTTYCRFCLHRTADPMALPSSYTLQRFLGSSHACTACWDYLAVVGEDRFYRLLRLARQYSWDRRDVA